MNIVCAAFALVLVTFHLNQPSGTGALAGKASQIAIWTPPFYCMLTVEGVGLDLKGILGDQGEVKGEER